MTRYLRLLALLPVLAAGAVCAQDAKPAQPGTRAFLELLYDGAHVHAPELKGRLPELRASSPGDTRAFLEAHPLKAERIADQVSFNRSYRFIQAYYENRWIVFDFGESGEWKDKLYGMSFSIVYQGEKVAPDQTRVYRRLVRLYGNPDRQDKFRDGARILHDLVCHVWVFPDTVISYRAPYFPDSRETVAVVQFTDRDFREKGPDTGMPGC